MEKIAKTIKIIYKSIDDFIYTIDLMARQLNTFLIWLVATAFLPNPTPAIRVILYILLFVALWKVAHAPIKAGLMERRVIK